MRLICPNCGAQYEVPDEVIPEAGRDVQCSNCGDTWFQKHPSQDQDLAEDLEQPLDEAHWDAPDEDTTPTEPEPAPEAEPEPEPVAATRAEPEPETEDDTDTDTAWDPDPAFDEEDDDVDGPAPEPRALPTEVREVLREEASRETRARAADASGGLETQPDLGLEDPSDDESRRERETRLRMARMRGQSEAEALAAAGAAGSASRRDLLPDIEEINSTLRKGSERRPAATEAEAVDAPPQRSGFGRGFMLMLLLAVLLVTLYVYAVTLGDLAPPLKPALTVYVGLVDQGRGWLDAQATGLMQWLDSMASSAETPAAPVSSDN